MDIKDKIIKVEEEIENSIPVVQSKLSNLSKLLIGLIVTLGLITASLKSFKGEVEGLVKEVSATQPAASKVVFVPKSKHKKLTTQPTTQSEDLK